MYEVQIKMKYHGFLGDIITSFYDYKSIGTREKIINKQRENPILLKYLVL